MGPSETATLHGRLTRASRWIDSDHPAVRERARELAQGRTGAAEVAEACFLWVRDRIRHIGDHGLEPLARFASEVLEHESGICWAKSHLLAALLRANRIPAGLVYQRLAADDTRCGFVLHGLNAVWLPSLGWYRLDARGARADLRAEFTPPREVLPYSPSLPGERTFPGLWAEPVAPIREALERHRSRSALVPNLPDAEDLGAPDLPLA
jgi:transglutaminase-like putative cysteine protease